MAEEKVLPWWLRFLDYVSVSENSVQSVLRQLAKTNISVTGITACFLLYTRSVGVAYFAAGAVACSMSVKVIKKFIRQPRPLPTAGARKKVSYG